MKRMKKALCFATLLGLSLCAVACGDGDKTDYCDAGFVDKCENGVYLRCETPSGKTQMEIVSYDVFTVNDIAYVCNDKDELKPRDLKCENGKIVDSTGKSQVALCDLDGNTLFCSGDNVTVQRAFCHDNSTYICEDGKIRSFACGDTNSCVEYERGELITASCFPSENVSDGCGDTTVLGSCIGTELIFCSSKNTQKGKTLKLDCKNLNGENGICAEISPEYGYDCTQYCGSKETNDLTIWHGACHGNTLQYCTEDGKVAQLDCAALEKPQVCGLKWEDAVFNAIFDCIDIVKE